MRNLIVIALLILNSSFVISFTEDELFTQAEQRFLELLNEKRKAKKLTILKTSECLNEAAKFHSQYLVKENKFAHQQKDKATKLPYNRIFKFCNEDPKVSMENILKLHYSGNESAEQLAQQFYNLWYNSPGHKANMFNKDIELAGIGSTRTKKNELMVTLVGAKF